MNTIQKDLICKIQKYYKGCLAKPYGEKAVAVGEAKLYFEILDPDTKKIRLFTQDQVSSKFFNPWVKSYAKQIR